MPKRQPSPSRIQTRRFLNNYANTLTNPQKTYLAKDKKLQSLVARYQYDDPTVVPDTYIFEKIQERIYALLGIA